MRVVDMTHESVRFERGAHRCAMSEPCDDFVQLGPLCHMTLLEYVNIRVS